MSQPSGAWQEYRKRRNLFLFAFVGYVPIVFLVVVVTIGLFHSDKPAFAAAFAWMAFFVVVERAGRTKVQVPSGLRILRYREALLFAMRPASLECRSQNNIKNKLSAFVLRAGGEGGIRTPDTLTGMPHFECGGINHSPTSPRDADWQVALRF